MGWLVLGAVVGIWLLAFFGVVGLVEYEEDDVEEMAGDRPAVANRDDPAP